VETEVKPDAVVEVADPVSGRTLTARVVTVGSDTVVVVSGGDRPHVGCAVLAVPAPGRSAPTVSLLTVPQHKEEPIARSVAEAVCRRRGTVTVATAGVHEEGVDREGIEIYLRLGGELAEAVARRVAETK